MQTPEEIFNQLARKYCGSGQLISSCWKELDQAYSASDRHYHNFQHLGEMLDHFERYRSALRHPDAVLFAIFYHDLVWEAARNDNEVRSADLSEERLLQLGVSEETRKRCKAHILATIDHLPTTDPDTAWLVDFDLAILGAKAERYQQFVDGIRKEFAQFEGPIFDQGRAAMIQKMLDRESIFLTEVHHSLYESTARKNLSDELKTLRSEL